MNPFLEAIQFIKYATGTGSGQGMAKLIFSIYNDRNCFGYGECIRAFDRERLDLALRMITHYHEHGEDAELREAGRYVADNYPRLIELANVMSDAKYDLREKWRREEEAKYADED